MRISDWSSDVCSSDLDVVGIGEAGFLAGNRAHAHALFDRMRAVPDDAVLDRPGLAPRMLEVQVAEIDAGAEQRTEGAFQPGRIEACGRQQAGLGRSEEHTSELQSLMRISYAAFCLTKKHKSLQHQYNIN